MADEVAETLLTLTADIVAAHVSNNTVPVSELGGLIERVHGALVGLGQTTPEPEPELKPAVSVRASIKPGQLVCLEDGKSFKTLKRHLRVDHGLTPDEYRAKWNLPADYPMVSADYAQTRRDMAVRIGLGRKPGAKKPVKRR